MAWGRSRDGARGRAADDARLAERVRSGERVLAAAWSRPTVDPEGAAVAGEAVGGTVRAFYLPDGAVLGWNEIDQAVWHQEENRLDLVTLPIGGPARAYQVHLADPPGRLPELVRERVTSSIVVNQRVPLDGRRGARIIARRLPGSDELDWIVVYDPGVDADDTEVKERVRDAVAAARADLGV